MAGRGAGAAGAVLNAEEWKKRIRDAFQLFEHKEGSNETVERCARAPPPPPAPRPAARARRALSSERRGAFGTAPPCEPGGGARGGRGGRRRVTRATASGRWGG